jgi:hypothetical protein
MPHSGSIGTYADVVNLTVDVTRLPEAVAGIEGIKKKLKGRRGFRGATSSSPTTGMGCR